MCLGKKRKVRSVALLFDRNDEKEESRCRFTVRHFTTTAIITLIITKKERNRDRNRKKFETNKD